MLGRSGLYFFTSVRITYVGDILDNLPLCQGLRIEDADTKVMAHHQELITFNRDQLTVFTLPASELVCYLIITTLSMYNMIVILYLSRLILHSFNALYTHTANGYQIEVQRFSIV